VFITACHTAVPIIKLFATPVNTGTVGFYLGGRGGCSQVVALTSAEDQGGER
jgi:hypothetical protein